MAKRQKQPYQRLNDIYHTQHNRLNNALKDGASPEVIARIENAVRVARERYLLAKAAARAANHELP